jgi:predicted TIM-barrel fold metal-dependent hydrolase
MIVRDSAWLALVHEEPVDPNRRIVDAHHHLWGEGQGLAGAPRYLSQDLLADINGHNVVASVYVECGIAYRSDGPEHLRPVGETGFAAGEARRSAATRAPIRGIVGHADLACDEDRLQQLLDAHARAGEGLFRGIRQLPGGLHGGAPRNPLSEPAFARGLAQLGRNGFSFDAFAIPAQLPMLAELARATPGTTIVLNHVGMPIYRPGTDDREAVMAGWREGMRQLAACPNVFVKLGGIGMDSQFGMGWSARERPPTSDEVVAWWGADIAFCIDSFGPDRCLFESNFPVDRWAVGYTVLWNAFQKMAGGYSEHEQDALFSGTAIRAYRLDL